MNSAPLSGREVFESLVVSLPTATANHLRKLVSADGKFERAGWNAFELPAEVD